MTLFILLLLCFQRALNTFISVKRENYFLMSHEVHLSSHISPLRVASTRRTMRSIIVTSGMWDEARGFAACSHTELKALASASSCVSRILTARAGRCNRGHWKEKEDWSLVVLFGFSKDQYKTSPNIDRPLNDLLGY